MTKTINFINKIDIEQWNKKSNDFINLSCDQQILDLNKNDTDVYDLITKDGQKIKSFDEHLNLYLENRLVFIETLKEKAKLLEEHTSILVVREDYIGTYDPKISYTVTTDNSKNTYLFYIKSNVFEKTETLEYDDRLKNYNSLISEESVCINEFQNIFNTISFETIFYIDEENEIAYDIKEVYFGNLKID